MWAWRHEFPFFWRKFFSTLLFLCSPKKNVQIYSRAASSKNFGFPVFVWEFFYILRYLSACIIKIQIMWNSFDWRPLSFFHNRSTLCFLERKSSNKLSTMFFHYETNETSQATYCNGGASALIKSFLFCPFVYCYNNWIHSKVLSTLWTRSFCFFQSEILYHGTNVILVL